MFIPIIYNNRDNYFFFLNKKVEIIYNKIRNYFYINFVKENIGGNLLIKAEIVN